MLPLIQIKEYINHKGYSPFKRWFMKLDSQAAIKVTTYLARIENGNFSQVKGIGDGVFECRINCGPGYRIYLGKDGESWVILLGGGIKRGQKMDIERAKSNWKNYKLFKTNRNYGHHKRF